MVTQSLMRVWHYCKHVVAYRLSINKNLVRVRWNKGETVLGYCKFYWKKETHFCSI